MRKKCHTFAIYWFYPLRIWLLQHNIYLLCIFCFWIFTCIMPSNGEICNVEGEGRNWEGEKYNWGRKKGMGEEESKTVFQAKAEMEVHAEILPRGCFSFNQMLITILLLSEQMVFTLEIISLSQLEKIRLTRLYCPRSCKSSNLVAVDEQNGHIFSMRGYYWLEHTFTFLYWLKTFLFPIFILKHVLHIVLSIDAASNSYLNKNDYVKQVIINKKQRFLSN